MLRLFVRRPHFGNIAELTRIFASVVTIAPIAHLDATDLDRPDPSLDRAIRSVLVTHDLVATIRQLATKA